METDAFAATSKALNDIFSIQTTKESGEIRLILRATKEPLEHYPEDITLLSGWKERVLFKHLPQSILQYRNNANGKDNAGMNMAISKFCFPFNQRALSVAAERTKAMEKEKKPVVTKVEVSYDVFHLKSNHGACTDIVKYMKEECISPQEEGIVSITTIAPREAFRPPEIDKLIAACSPPSAPSSIPSDLSLLSTPSSSPQWSLSAPASEVLGESQAMEETKTNADATTTHFEEAPYTLDVDEQPLTPRAEDTMMLTDTQTEPFQLPPKSVNVTSKVEKKTITEDKKNIDEPNYQSGDKETMQKQTPKKSPADILATIAMSNATSTSLLETKELYEEYYHDEEEEEEEESDMLFVSKIPAVDTIEKPKKRVRSKQYYDKARQDSGVTSDEERMCLIAFSRGEKKIYDDVKDDPVALQAALNHDSARYRSRTIKEDAKDDYVFNGFHREIYQKAGFDDSSDQDDDDYSVAEEGDEDEEEEEPQHSVEEKSEEEEEEEEQQQQQQQHIITTPPPKKSRSSASEKRREKLDVSAKQLIPRIDKLKEHLSTEPAAAAVASNGRKRKRSRSEGNGKQKPIKKSKHAEAIPTEEEKNDFDSLCEVIELIVEHLSVKAPRSRLSKIANSKVTSKDLKDEKERRDRRLFWDYGFEKPEDPSVSNILFKSCVAYMDKVRNANANERLAMALEMIYDKDSKISVDANPVKGAGSFCALSLFPSSKLFVLHIDTNDQHLSLPVCSAMADLIRFFHFGTHFYAYVRREYEDCMQSRDPSEEDLTSEERVGYFIEKGASRVKYLADRWIEAHRFMSR